MKKLSLLVLILALSVAISLFVGANNVLAMENEIVMEFTQEPAAPVVKHTEPVEIEPEHFDDQLDYEEPAVEANEAENTKPEQFTETETDYDGQVGNGDYIGRFQIESVGLDVGCYATNSQQVVDDADSAACFYAVGHNIIADHNYQGFDSIKSCEEGDIAKIVTGDSVREYICVEKMLGHNTGKTLTDADWNSIETMHVGALVCYTCNENWQNVTIVFFVPAEST